MPSSAKCARKALINWVRCAHQQIAYSMLHQPALLLGRFDRDEPHGWAPDRFADRLGVGGIVLVALDVGLHILRRHQPNLMPELRQFTRPIMCRGAGFHADKARRQSFEELYQLAAAKLLPDDDLLGRINAVNLEHVLGDIQTDRGNLHVDGSSHVIRLRRTTLWHSMPGAGVVHHINSDRWRKRKTATWRSLRNPIR